jgi:hypothetical protein
MVLIGAKKGAVHCSAKEYEFAAYLLDESFGLVV